jgi:ADP-ribose pyrophosphatase YjhB (NUDIX family)
MLAQNEKGTRLLDIFDPSCEECVAREYSPLVASLVIAVHNGRVLLVYERHKNHWELPAGAIEARESPRQCAIRELLEESGQHVDDLQLVWVTRFLTEGARQPVYAAIFAGNLTEVRLFSQTEEISGITFWPDMGHLAATFDGIGKYLAVRYLSHRKGRPPSQLGRVS